MQTGGKRLLLAALFLVLIAGCTLSIGLWRLWVAVGGVPAAPGAGGEPLAPTPTLATIPEGAGGEGGGPDAVDPAAPQPGGTNALTGTYEGTVYGDGGSSALLRLELVQQGTTIAGTATIGEGLQIDAGGFCGSFAVPATRLQADEELDRADSRHLSTTSNVSVEGFEIPVRLEATLSEDGQSITAAATLDTPAVCTNDPTVTGTLVRTGG